MTNIDIMKKVLREKDIPFFSNSDLEFYLEANNNEVNAAIYQCALVKAEDTTISISGLTTADSSAYFRKLAYRYRPNNSGTLRGV